MIGVVLVALALAIGLYARFAGLGIPPLAMDEYYFVRSVENVLDFGVPRFASGGYYDRGAPVQYLAAASVKLFGSNDFAFRLPAALFSLAGALLAYFYARLYVPRGLALAVAAALLLSSWQVEFARFARMYTAVQCTTLGLLLAAHRAYVIGQPSVRYLPHLLLVAGYLCHSLTIVFLPVLLLPYLPGSPARPRSRAAHVRFALAGLATAGALAWVTTANLRHWGVQDPLPPNYDDYHQSLLRLPASPLWSPTSNDEIAVIAIMGALALAGGIALFRGASRRSIDGASLLVAVAFAAALLHQFAFVALAGAVLVLRYQIHQPSLHPRSRYIWLAGTALVAAGWVAYAALAPGWIDAAAPGDPLRAWRKLLFGFPDLFAPLVVPWRDELPRLGLLFAAGLGIGLLLHRDDPPLKLAHQPPIVGTFVMLCFGVLSAQGLSTRYFFFVYPVLLTSVALVIHELWQLAAVRWTVLSRFGATFAVALFALLFALTDDFHPAHLWNVTSDEVRLRLGRWERYEAPWFWRYDFETPARFVAAHAASDGRTRILNVNQPPVSYYLGREHAIYVPRGVGRFPALSRERGTLDLWSNQRMLADFDAVRDYTRCARFVWLVRYHDGDRAGWPFFEDPEIAGFQESEIWRDRLVSSDRHSLGRDGRVEARLVELRDPSAEPCSL